MTPRTRAEIVASFADVWLDVHGLDQSARPSTGAAFWSQISAVAARPEALAAMQMADDKLITEMVAEIQRRYDGLAAAERLVEEAYRG